jgi:hypothetical protein
MTDVDAHQLAVQVQVALAVDIPEIDALRASDRYGGDLRLRSPVIHRVPLGELGDLLSSQGGGPIVHRNLSSTSCSLQCVVVKTATCAQGCEGFAFGTTIMQSMGIASRTDGSGPIP